MSLTEHCNVFGAFHEDGFNKIVEHIMRQRPSLFNYASLYFATRPDQMCRKIVVHPEVIRRANPLITIEDPLPIPGTGGHYGVDFCAQLAEARIDFHPGNAIGLPPELSPLGPQQAALSATFCVGLACPDAKRTEFLGDLLASEKSRDSDNKDQRPTIQPIPAEHINCFCLEVYATLHLARVVSNGSEFLVLRLDGFEIVDIEPKGLEDALECYVATILRVGILPKIRLAIDTLTFEMGSFLTLNAKLTPISADVPNNPAIEDDQIKVFVDLGI